MKIKTNMNNKTPMIIKGWTQSLGALLLTLCLATAQAQTVLVDPAGDGGFELGSGSFADNGWTVVNDSQFVANRWYTGTGLTNGSYSFPSANRCAYVSADNGATWSYANNGTYYSIHFYKDITVPAGETNVKISFKYQQNGNSGNAKLIAYLATTADVPVVGQPTSGSTTIGVDGWGTGSGARVIRFLNSYSPESPGTVTFNGSIPPSMLNNCGSSTTFRLVFTWNSSTGINNPPAAVDEISVVSYPQSPLSTVGTYTINKSLPTSGSNFNTFTEAIQWLNAVSQCGIANPITFNIPAGQTFYEDLPAITASGSASNPITFQRSGSGSNPVITPSGIAGTNDFTPRAADFGICLRGADYITIDGIDITAINNQIEFGYLIANASSTNGASNNTIKNTTILLDRTNVNSRGIYSLSTTTGSVAFSATNNTGTNNNNSYLNLTIGNVYAGIQFNSTSDLIKDTNNIIGTTSPSIFNIIGRPGVPNDIGSATLATATYGINCAYQQSLQVFNNQITNVSAAGAVDGILIGSTSGLFGGLSGVNNKIYNNIITGIRNTSTTSTSVVSGMRMMHYNVSQGVIIKIYNNVISGLTTGYSGAASATRAIRGMYLPFITNITAPNSVTYEIINNSIVIDGSGSPTISNIAFEASSTAPVFIIRNNLFANLTGAQTGSAVHYAMMILPVQAQAGPNKLGAAGSVSNYNDLYLASTTNGHIGAYGTSGASTSTLATINNLTTFINWQTNFSSPAQDANSISANPVLNSSTILKPNYGSPLSGSFPSLGAPYDVDITGVTRSLSNSTIGAYERVGDAIAPVINDTTLLSVYTTSNRTLTGFLTITDNTQVSTTPGLAPRIYFKKSTDANVFGANTSGANGWKWVEASNSTSPFDFTIDYSLLNGGSANVNDTIQYFYLAQDTLTIPNITVYPASGFIGSTVASVTQAPTSPRSYIVLGSPAAFVDATVAQASTFKVEQNSNNNKIIRIAVQTNGTGAPAYVSAITFNSVSLRDYSNISNAKVWYTGSSSTFAANTPFGTYTVGAGSGALGNFTVSGNQLIPNGTSYFWLTYDVKSAAFVTDTLDASVVSVTYNGIAETPSVSTATGVRVIKASYCVPAITSTGYCISNVTLNTLNNTSISNLTPPCAPTFYSNYAPEGTQTTTLLKGSRYTLSVLVNVNAGAKIYAMFDYNDNGVFDTAVAAGEIATITTASSVNIPVNYSFTVPCTATANELKMRIRSVVNSLSPADPACTATPNSEVEDYTLTLVDNPASYVSSSATQNTTSIAPSATNAQVMQIAVVGSGCGTASLTEVKANTGLSSNAATDIASVKLYGTGKSKTFNTNTLLTSMASPSGAFTLNGFTDALYTSPGDTNYYWIAYDLQPGATINNLIDISLDSMLIAGSYVVPTNNNPAGTSTILAPMSYLSTDVVEATTNTVAQSTTNAQILRINIRTAPTGAPIPVTKFNLNTAGGTIDTLNISTARMYYTGSSSIFSSSTLFGTSSGYNVSSSAWDPYSISGLQALSNGDNYFWLVYDIKSGASIGSSVDAALDSAIVNGNLITPTTTAITGNRLIRAPYCSSAALSANFEEIYNVTFGTLNNTSFCFTTANNSQSIVGRYSDYSGLPATSVAKGVNIPYSVKTGSCGSFQGTDSLLIYIDWNQDGDFTDAGETVVRRSVPQVNNTFSTGSILVPCTAMSGETRMRVIFSGSSGAMTPCLTGNPYGVGETEDYTIVVTNNPISVVSLNPIQSNSFVAQNTSNNMIMRIPVIAQGCGTTDATAFYFKTTGTTNTADLAAAKLYYTGTSSTFTTANLLGTVSNPSGPFSFSSVNTALSGTPGDTNNFWLAYDISNTATLTNVVDAELDSMQSLLGNHVSASGNPSGNAQVSPYMSHIATVVTHPDLSAVGRPSFNKRVLKVMIVTSSTGAPAILTDLNFNSNGGGNDLSNVDSIRVFYTGRANVFSTANQYGLTFSSVSPGNWGPFTITGSQALLNDTNYFWLTYNVKATATIGDSIDAAFVSSTINGIGYTPVNGAPAGRILIRQEYCTSAAASFAGANWIGILNVQMSNLNNASGCVSAGYSNFTNVTPANITKNSPTPFTILANNCGFGFSYSATAIYIDYNQDGDFTDPGEEAFNDNTDIEVGTYLPITGNITVPCSALLGETRMRIIKYRKSLNPTISPCGTYASYGETEDYLVNILDNPQVYTGSSASQSSGLVAAGVNEVMMQIKVKASNCGNGVVSQMFFNTEGSTAPLNDIASAKLYATGASNVFSSANLLGTVTNPLGQFSFSFSNPLLTNNTDTNNYWLVYEVTPFANLYDTLDVRIDSIEVLGSMVIPANPSPAEKKIIDFPMTYVSSTTVQTGADIAALGTTDVQLLRMEVIASSTGSPINITQFNLNTNGGANDSLNISSAKIYYTGNDSNFSATNLFGSYPITAPSTLIWPAYAITGSQALATDTNYFWLVYDIKSSANIGDSVDAELLSIVVGGITQTPTVTAPAGHVLIRSEYCIPGSFSSGRCINNVQFGSINNSTGCESSPYYTIFPESVATTNVYRNSTLPITVTGSTPTYMIVFIDFNRNGLYSDPGEQFDLSTVNQVTSASMSISIPSSARLGLTRMRIRTYNFTATGHPSCATYNNSENEDYYITIMPEVPPTTYVWNQTSAADFNVAANWTPSRISSSPNDRLVFGDGTPTTLTVNNVFTQTNATIEVAPSTTLLLNAGSSATLDVKDSLILGSDAFVIPSSNLTLQVGTSSTLSGTLELGSNARINGQLVRWVGATTTNLIFPICDLNKTNRSVQINYTTPPSAYGTISVSYNNAPVTGTAGLPLTDMVSINKLAVNGYWNINPGNGLTGGVYTGTFAADSLTNVIDPSNLTVISRVDQFSNWTLNGTFGSSSGTSTNAVLVRTAMSSFGQFTVASDSLLNPLPVKLTRFVVHASNGNVETHWATSSEENNRGFELERSTDGRAFTKVTFVKGAGNSLVTQQYSYTDADAFIVAQSNILYYRLKQLDLNGKYTYSEVQRVSKNNQSVNTLSVSPNPFTENYTLNFDAAAEGSITVTTTDFQGRLIDNQQVSISKGSNVIEFDNFSHLKAGIYFIKVVSADDTQVIKIVKK